MNIKIIPNQQVKKIGLVILIILMFTGVGLLYSPKTNALSGSSFNAGNIMDDSVFFNPNTMSASQIQAFLNSKVPSCDTNGKKSHGGTTRAAYGTSKGYPPPYTCLKDYSQNIPGIAGGGSELCKGSISSGRKSAAQIINDVAKACQTSPKVLLVLLQKEQSLVTDDWPWSIQYRSATGYGCPDTAPCDSEYYGFFNQVYQAAKSYQRYKANPDNYNYKANRNNTILYNPKSSCGTSNVFIQNQATAGLYIYTPYRPNQAALNNLYGTGNSCSSYGNRNFWRMYNDWFGSTSGIEIYPYNYDLSTDKTGEQAKIGFKLSKKPSGLVVLYFEVTDRSSAEVIENKKLIIEPRNWDKTDKNIVTVAGMDNSSVIGSIDYDLFINRIASSDVRYRGISTQSISPINLVQLDNSNAPNVYRLYSPTEAKHYFTSSKIDRDQRVSEGWQDEGVRFSYCYGGDKPIFKMTKDASSSRLLIGYSTKYEGARVSGYSFERVDFTASSYGNTPIYELYDSGKDRYLYSTSPNEGSGSGFVNTGIAFYACSSNVKPVFRLDKSGNRPFLTSSPGERNKAVNEINYKYKQAGFYICSNGTINVYRLYKRSTGKRFYTTSSIEKNKTVNKLNYAYEGVGFKLCANGNRSIFRLYKPSNGSRLYTASASERDSAVKNDGFRYEGVAFKVR